MRDRRVLLKAAVMESIADDYESLEHVMSWASTLLLREGVAASRRELLQILEELTKDGLAQGYLLSPVPPYSIRVPFAAAEPQKLWFYLTPDGLNQLSAS